MKLEVSREPIRMRRTLGEGASSVEALVFCRSRGRSVPLTECASCPYASVVPPGAEEGGVVECRGAAPLPRPGPRVDVAEAAARTRVGQLVPLHVQCVRADAPAEEVLECLEAGAPSVPIVGLDGRLVGLARAQHVLRARIDALATAADLATPPSTVLIETTPLSVAIATMAESTDAVVPVVSEVGTLVGVLAGRDLARWIAQRMGYAL